MAFCGVNCGVKSVSKPLNIKQNLVHLFFHKLVGKMCINSADKPFGTIAHPDIYDVGAHVFLTSSSKGVAKGILRQSVIVKNLFEYSVHYFYIPRRRKTLRKIQLSLYPIGYRDFFILDFPVFTFCVTADKEIAFPMYGGQFAGTKPKIQHCQDRLLILYIFFSL